MKNKFKIISECLIGPGFMSFEEAKAKAIERWPEGIGSMNPSFFPDKDDGIKLFEITSITSKHSSTPKECVYVSRRNNLFLPNVTGLVILESLDIIYNIIPDGAFVLGIDDIHQHRLYFGKHIGHMIPVLKKSNGAYSYMALPWNIHIEGDEIILLFEKR